MPAKFKSPDEKRVWELFAAEALHAVSAKDQKSPPRIPAKIAEEAAVLADTMLDEWKQRMTP